MKTINITITLSEREHELLVAAKSERPHPTRIKALLIAEARSTLRRLISMVDDERMSGGTAAREAEATLKRVRVQNESYYGLDSKLLDKAHAEQQRKLVLKSASSATRRSSTRKPNASDHSAVKVN